MTRRETTALAISVLSGFLTGYGLSIGPPWLAFLGILIVVAMYASVSQAPTWLKGKRS